MKSKAQGRDLFRHCYVSYRCADTDWNFQTVANETGHSVQQLKSSYLKLVGKRESKEWFSTFPDKAHKWLLSRAEIFRHSITSAKQYRLDRPILMWGIFWSTVWRITVLRETPSAWANSFWLIRGLFILSDQSLGMGIRNISFRLDMDFLMNEMLRLACRKTRLRELWTADGHTVPNHAQKALA